MNEIERLYKNAGLANVWVEEYDDKQFFYSSYSDMIATMMKNNDWDRKTAISIAKRECRKILLPFTSEKQFQLIRWLVDNKSLPLEISKCKAGYYFGNSYINFVEKSFEEALAKRVNNAWQLSNEEDKEQIRRILCPTH